MLKYTAALLLLVSAATAQEIQPINPALAPAAPQTSQPVPVQPVPLEPVPNQPVNVPVTLVQPTSLPGVTATLSSPLALRGRASLVLKVTSTLPKAVILMTNRDNRQDCAFAPSIRVVKVGSREVVYPDGSGNVKLCAQDMNKTTIPAKGTVHFTRTLNLPAGEYMVEGWFLGSADGTRVKLDAQPIRVSVK